MITKIINYFIKKAAHFRLYLQRSSFYTQMINFVSIIAILKESYDIHISAFILAPVLFGGILLVGYLDYRLILPNQLSKQNQQNDLKADLQEIKSEIRELKESGEKNLNTYPDVRDTDSVKERG